MGTMMLCRHHLTLGEVRLGKQARAIQAPGPLNVNSSSGRGSEQCVPRNVVLGQKNTNRGLVGNNTCKKW
jgi:hypothetical protein